MPPRLRPWLLCTVAPVEGGTTPPPTPPAAPPAPAPSTATVGANGFPENTPVKDMTAEHQAAYWRHQSRQHEDRSKAKDTTIADLQRQVTPPAPKSDTDKAIDDRVAAALAPLTVDLVSARIEAAVARRGIDTATVQPLIDGLDVNKFLKDGKPDAERITAWAAALPAPATGTPPATPRPGTGPTFQGRESGNPTGTNGLSAGAAAYAADKDKPKTPFT